jgi:phage regulator Rha-like protein
MNMLAQFNQNQKTMSTRVIAELCEKQPQHVKRDCENMFVSLDLDASKFGHIYFDSINRQQTEYLLDEELTMTLVTGYNIVLRNRVIKRWKELESRELSKMEILQMALESEQQR